MSRDDTPWRILRSTGAATASQLWRTLVVTAVHLALRHLIPPQDWGLWDWTQVVFLVLAAARDLGLPAHTLRLRPSPFGTLLRVQATWGPILALLVFAGAPALARGFAGADPTLVWVLRAFCLFLVFEGLALVPLMYFEGSLRLERTLPAEMVRSLVFAVIAITMAVLGYGVWSLIVGHLAGSATFAGLLWWWARGELPLIRYPGPLRRLIGGGIGLGVIGLLALSVKYLDPLVLATRFPPEIVGTYGFAYWIAFLATTLLVHPIGRAVYPALIGFRYQPERAFETYRLATLLLLALEVPAALVLFLNAELAVRLLGGTGWEGAPALLRLLCFVPLLDPLGRFAGDLFIARHQERLWILANLSTLLALAGAGFLFTGWLGPRGMAFANYLPLGSLLVIWGLHRIAPAPFLRLLRELLTLYLLPLPLFAAAWWLTDGRPWLRLALSAVAAAGAFGLYVYRFGGSFRAFFRAAG